ncbi:uncharacterized protein LOC110746875, partial [Prunus avium]|uniref:Uncharacterized protein LOC110746875 n=1 Tax=Prunus avium TaxID=42229 RepID=A0A6P5RII3_PRUAV
MLGPPTILSFLADSQKHAVNPTDPTTRTRASITTTKCSVFHTSSKKSAWIIDSDATDHITFDHGLSRKSSTSSVMSNANGHPYGKDDWLCNSNPTLLLKHDEGKLTALIVYVDDIVVTGNNTGEQLKLKKNLSQEFEMNDLGDLKYFLEIEVARSKTGIFLSQMKYVMDLLTKTGMLGCKPANTPIEICVFGTHKTRLDIAYVVTMVSQFMHSPNVSHRNVVDQILRYLKLAPGKGLIFSKNGDLEVVGYTDVDWAGSITDRRSTSGYFTFVG